MRDRVDDETPRAGDEHRPIEEPPARPGREVRGDQAKLIGAIRELGPKARAVLVVIDYDDDDGVSYKIEEAGPGLDQWHDILGVLAGGTAYAQSEMFAPVIDDADDMHARSEREPAD